MVMSLLLALMMSVQADDFPFGPLDQRAHGLFQIGTAGFTPDAPTSLKEGDLQIHMSMSSANVMNDAKPLYVADMEFERVGLSMWYGVDNRLTMGISIPFETVSGGFQDSLISSFHKTFGLNNGTRDQFERNKINATIRGKTYRVSPELGMGDIFAVVNCKIFQDGDTPGWSVGYNVKFPTAARNDIYDSQGYGFGITTNVFHQMGDFYVNGGASIARTGSEEVFGQKLKPMVQTLFFMAEYRMFDWLSFVAQGIAQSGMAYDLGEYSRWSFEVDGGFKVAISKHMMWDVGFFENVVKYSNSADFGLFTGLTLKY